jgi:lysyl-tRNA synthetase class II/acyl-CoA reductase-like NAD-dependent aldehyde dehydrogenase
VDSLIHAVLIAANYLVLPQTNKEELVRSKDTIMATAPMLEFPEVTQTCALFADHLRSRREHIHSALASYASYPAVEDELARATYLLENLEENREYFQLKVEQVAAFLPRNQLLYATVYMGVIPAFMSNRCHVRPPESAHAAYKRLLHAVDFASFVPNLRVFLCNRGDFVASNVPAADVVIFTGTYANGELIRKQLQKDALFLFSGSGHNPVIVRKDADLVQSADSIVRLCYHNQGQDCSAPNAILVDRAVCSSLFCELYDRTLSVEAAMRLGRHPENVIAANTDRAHLVASAETFLTLQPHLVHGGVLDTKTQVICPTIFRKPLKYGPQLTEFFAPVIMLQEYEGEDELHKYFDHPRYRANAMYLTVFGRNAQIEALGELDVHPPATILHNRNLHEEEKGTRPYGGYGSEASFIWFGGIKRPTPILPQREIYQHLIAQRPPGDGSQKARTRPLLTARDARLERRQRLGGLGVRTYRPHFVPTVNSRNLVDRYGQLVKGECTQDRVIVAGRVVASRNSGMFLDLRDSSGKIQIFCHDSQLGQHDLELLKLVDVGDLLGVEGCVRRTQRGELTIAANKLTLLAKDLLPLPERPSVEVNDNIAGPRRMLDHIHAERQRKLVARSEAVAAVRTLMNSLQFQDVETWALEPKLNAIPGPEIQLGAATMPGVVVLLAEGLSDRAYEIDAGISARKSYLGQSIVADTARAYADWCDMMALGERLISSVVQRLCDAGFTPEGTIDLSSPFTSKSMLTAVQQETGVDFFEIKTDDEARRCASSLGCEIVGHETWGRCLTSVFLGKVVPKLTASVHVTHLPKAISLSAVADEHDPRVAECFATYINGQLICSGSTLLNDPFEYRERISDGPGRAEDVEAWRKENHEEFAGVFERGMPPAAVMRTAIGRLASLFVDHGAEPRAA